MEKIVSSLVLALLICQSMALTWQKLPGPGYGNANSVIFNPATGAFIIQARGSGLFQTTDSGASWTAVSVEPGSALHYCLGVGAAGELYVGTDKALFSSIDNGSNWTQISQATASNQLSVTACFQGPGGEVYYSSGVYGPAVIHRLAQGASTWENFTLAASGYGYTAAFAATSHGVLLAGTSFNGLYLSADSGHTWAATPSIWPSGAGKRVYSLAVDDSDNVYVGTAGGVFKTADSGATWSSASIAGETINALAAEGGTIAAGTNSGKVYISVSHGGAYSQAASFMGVNGIAIHGQALIVGTAKGAWRSIDGGATFQESNSGLNVTQQVDALVCTADSALYSGSRNTGVYRSTDWGNTWFELNSGLNGSGVWDFCVNDSGQVLASGRGTYSFWLPVGDTVWQKSDLATPASYGLLHNGDVINVQFSGGGYVSHDGGKTFTHIAGLTGNPQCIGVDPLTGRVFVGTEGAGVWMSEDNGVNWTQVTTMSNGAALGFNAQGEAFYFEPPYRWTGGTTWVACTGIPYNHRVISYLLGPTGVMYAGTDAGIVYISNDNGRNWTQDPGFPAAGVRILDMAMDSAGYIYAGMRDGFGIYRTTTPVGGGVRTERHAPVRRAEPLFSCAPNPFYASVSLRIGRACGPAEVRIYSQDGALMGAMRAGQTPAVLLWDARRLPAGVYLARARAGNKVFNTRITLLK